MQIDPGASWDELIVLCAANSWDDVKLADRHMAEHLTAHAPVLYVDPPVSHLTRFNKPAVAASMRRPRLRSWPRALAPTRRSSHPNPPSGGDARGLAYRSTPARERRPRSACRACRGRDLDLALRRRLRRVRRGPAVYWWQDDPVGGAAHWGVSAERLAKAEERLARASDLIVAVNEGATERWQARGLSAAYLPERLRRRLLRRRRRSHGGGRTWTCPAPSPASSDTQWPYRPRAARGRRRLGHVAAADRPEGPGFRARPLRAARRPAQRLLPRPAAVRGAAGLLQADRRGARAVRRPSSTAGAFR